MTLIIGILCQDGSIVVGADGAASLGVLGQMTARQPVKKLSLLHNCIIVGVSGTIGLSQRISGVFTKAYEEKKLSGKKPVEAMAIIRQRIWEDCLKQEYEIASQAQTVIGGGLAQKSCLCACIAALPISRENCLIQFDQQGHPEMATKDLPFVAIGSGQMTADPFLSFLKYIFWPNRLPTLGESIFAAYWTLEHAIRTSPGGVAEPKQIAVLEMKNGTPICRELDENEIAPHKEAVTNAENYLKNFQKPSPAITPIPQPADKPNPAV